MVVEAILLLTVVVGLGGLVVKLYEWRQDVLYGPYIRHRD